MHFNQYADDTSIFLSHKKVGNLYAEMNQELENISSWIEANKLSLNVNKTVYLLFSGKKVIDQLPQLKIFNQPIDRKSDTKFLGIYIDEKLSWKVHTQHVTAKISRMIGIMYKLRNELTKCAMRTLYISLIHSHLRYGLIYWGAADKNLLNPLFILQKKIIRLINCSGKIDHSEPLFRKSYILKLEDLISLEMAKFMFRDLRSANSHFNFQLRNSFHHYNTRNHSSIALPQPRSAILRNSIFFRGPSIYNDLPENIKSAPTLNSFKYLLKTHYVNNYESSM